MSTDTYDQLMQALALTSALVRGEPGRLVNRMPLGFAVPRAYLSAAPVPGPVVENLAHADCCPLCGTSLRYALPDGTREKHVECPRCGCDTLRWTRSIWETGGEGEV